MAIGINGVYISGYEITIYSFPCAGAFLSGQIYLQINLDQ